MKNSLKFLFSSLAVLLILAMIGKGLHRNRSKHAHISHALIENKPIVVIIPSYNNSAYCEKNLRSVFEQNYDNYRVIYIDDCSTDNTFEKVKEYIASCHQEERVELIRNEKNKGALANLYHAIHSCKNKEIVVTLDGDDFLAHEEVLSKLNRVYANPEVWMTYGNFVNYPTYTQKPVTCKKIPNHVIQNNTYRKSEWVTSHLRTFYAGLFKKIKLQHLIYNGKFFPMAWDLPLMLPMLEMSGRHATFIRDVLYLYNRSNPINDHKVNVKQQSACAEYARKLPVYERLTKLDLSEDEKMEKEADLLIFSSDHSKALHQLLKSIDLYTWHLNRISVLYRATKEEEIEAYIKLKELFPSVHFYSQLEKSIQDFRSLFFQAAFDASSLAEYIVFATDECIIHKTIDFSSCIGALQRTKAYGFYLSPRCAEEIPLFIPLEAGINAWQFKEASHSCKYPNRFDMALYRKEDVHNEFSKIPFHDLSTLKEKWSQRIKKRKMGLFYENS